MSRRRSSRTGVTSSTAPITMCDAAATISLSGSSGLVAAGASAADELLAGLCVSFMSVVSSQVPMASGVLAAVFIRVVLIRVVFVGVVFVGVVFIGGSDVELSLVDGVGLVGRTLPLAFLSGARVAAHQSMTIAVRRVLIAVPPGPS